MSLNLYSGHAVLGMVISEQKSAPLRLHMQYTVCKGQLISKGLFDVIVWTKKPTKKGISNLKYLKPSKWGHPTVFEIY